MKKYLLLSGLQLAILTLTFGQTYFDYFSTWNQYFEASEPGIIETKEHFNFEISGDTTINNQSYFKVRKIGTGMDIEFFSGSPDTIEYDFDRYFAALRQEDKKVFFVLSNTVEKELIYDFDWLVGDTIECSFNSCVIVDSIGTIEFNGQTRKHFFLTGTENNNNEIIEGIGFGTGLFRIPVPNPFLKGRLICYRQNNNVIGVSNADSCELITNLINLPSQDHKIKLFPNPFKSFINISSQSTEKIDQLQIFNLNGTLIQQTENLELSKTPIKLNLHSLKPGIYVMSLILKNKVKSFKLIKIE